MTNEIYNKNLFTIYSSIPKTPIGLISIPHSGEIIPSDFKQFLSQNQNDCHEDLDLKVNELIDIEELREIGVIVIVSHIHRVCIDLNRDRNSAFLAWPKNTLGIDLVCNRPSIDQENYFLDTLYLPYFEIIKSIIVDTTMNAKTKLTNPFSIIDLHSMPSRPTDYHLKKNPAQKIIRDDFCISDLDGKSCQKNYLENIEQVLKMKFSVSTNDPYKGGFITQFCHQFQNVNALQIEINRKIYMDETTKMLNQEKIKILKPFLTDVLKNNFLKFK